MTVKDKIKSNEKTYFDRAHTLGRIATLFVVGCMLGIPIFVSKKYNLPLDMKEVFKIASPLLAVFVPAAVAEFLSYMPVLGTSSYLTYLTGNVLNLKVPCVLNAQELNDAEPGTEKSDVVALLAVASSSITTMLIIILGIILMTPLTPILESPEVQTATQYILPALFGALILPIFGSNKVGKYKVKNRNIPILVSVVVMTIYNYAVSPIGYKTGYWIIITIAISVVLANIFFKKGFIEMTPLNDSKPKGEK